MNNSGEYAQWAKYLIGIPAVILFLFLFDKGSRVSESQSNRILQIEGVTEVRLNMDKHVGSSCGYRETRGTAFWGVKGGIHVSGWVCGGPDGYYVRYGR